MEEACAGQDMQAPAPPSLPLRRLDALVNSMAEYRKAADKLSESRSSARKGKGSGSKELRKRDATYRCAAGRPSIAA